jgi:hypothetical protein
VVTYLSSLACSCASFPFLRAVKVLIFSQIVCWIYDHLKDYVKIPVCQINDQVSSYTAIQKLLQTDITGVIYGSWNLAEFRPSCFSQLWQWIASVTGARRGSTLMSKKGIDLSYRWLNTRTCSSKGSPFFSPLNLAKNSKFRTFFLLKFPKSSSGMNFKLSVLRGILTVSLEINLGYQSNIYLQMTIREFFTPYPVASVASTLYKCRVRRVRRVHTI